MFGWRLSCSDGRSISRGEEEESVRKSQGAIELLSTGAPVSILIEYGLAEETVDALVKGDIGTVEKLGSMTPELLEALDGIDEATVGRIQQAINSYYGQEYAEEVPAQETEAGAETAVLAEEAEAETSATMSESVEAGADPGAVGETASQPESKETSAL